MNVSGVEKNPTSYKYTVFQQTRAIPLTTERASLALSSNYFFKNKCLICLLSKVFKSNFICEHKWKLKLLTVPLGYTQSVLECASPILSVIFAWYSETFTLLLHELQGGPLTFEALEEISALLGQISQSRLWALFQWDVFPLPVVCLDGVGSCILTWVTSVLPLICTGQSSSPQQSFQ